MSGRGRDTGWRRATAATVGALVVGVALSFILPRLPLGGEREHFGGHVAVGLPVLLVLLAVLWAWPRPSADRTGRMARWVLVVGLAMFGGGQVVEGVGAFGYSGNDRENALAGLHDLGFGVGTLGFLVAVAGALLSVLVAVARRLDAVDPRLVSYTVVALIILAFIALVVLVTVGAWGLPP